MARIHPTALVDAAAELDETAEIGPFAIVGAQVRIGAQTTIGPHCVIEGRTTIGRDNRIGAYCALGGAPQDKKYAGEPTELVIGDGNTIREYCNFNRGTVQDAGVTRLGDRNWIMANVHVAHDCRVGSDIVIANFVGLAGHVHVGDWAVIGGLSGVHQFCKLGAHVMVGHSSAVSQDVPPFMMADGNPLAARGFNLEGLRRRGFDARRIAVVKQMHRLLYRQKLTLEQAREAIAQLAADVPAAAADVALMTGFLAQAGRGIVR
ncbi:MAG TPA: acyl-ACP--UDP-N-acetylglucosamine O-acyltransferase [Rubrivivax sp.]|nr:acyl-ACP--UDP-N-acetylglucosamine O-acyltransferase [Rubrivivax sp.]